MKFYIALVIAFATLNFSAASAAPARSCQALFKFKAVSAEASSSPEQVRAGSRRGGRKTEKAQSDFKVPLEDQYIQSELGEIGFTYSFWGQKPLTPALGQKALDILNQNSLTTESIQKAHRALTNGKADLQFRGSSEAKVIGSYSFKGLWALTPHEIKIVEANPFLSFKVSDGTKNIGVINKELQIGDVQFPNVENSKKFAKLLSKETLAQIKNIGKSSEAKEKANQNILKDLLEWTLKEAELQLKSKKEEPSVVVALLEWRLKSLGLYYEQTYVDKGSYLESYLGRVDLNRSNELAELVVDAFSAKHNLEKEKIARTFRPKLTEDFSEWASYMKESLDLTGLKRVQELEKELQAIAKDLKESEEFTTYYKTLFMTAEIQTTTTASSILKGFKEYYAIHYSKNIPEEARVLMVPIDFIKNFGKTPASFKEYYEKYYFNNATLFRGVSNGNALTDINVMSYFKSYKGRFASEVSRSHFQKRNELTKLAMLQFNTDLIARKVVESAAQHAAKHMGYVNPNSAKTYFVSAADLSTIAFRFAMDKGYVTHSSSNTDGNTHLVFEFLLPRHGTVDFSEFKLTNPTWKNYFPRQRETSIAGGLDPHSLVRIYVLEAYTPVEEVPSSGPEKHGYIVKIFERDQKNPEQINLKVRKSEDEWKNAGEFDLKKLGD